ncbi:hypothetical protein Tco_0444660 [Tanacetum coccineum]
MEIRKHLSKDANGTDVDVHLYRSIIRSLMYLTSSRPDIMFVMCACSRFQVQQKFSYACSLVGGAGAGLDRIHNRRLQFLGLQANLFGNARNNTKLWLIPQLKQNTLLLPTAMDSAICVVKNLVYHSKTKHIEIRHHFIRDSYEKRLIEMVKILTDYNVADLLTKSFDVSRFQFLIASIVLKGKHDAKILNTAGLS